MIRISPDGVIEFIHSEGERIFVCGNKKAYLYGVVDAPDRLCQMATENYSSFLEKKHEIIGTYTLVIVDEDKLHLRLYRSSLGGNKTVYYMKKKDGIYIFSSIKVLNRLGYKFKFNDEHDVVYDFIYNGFIRSKSTLLRGVSKLLTDEYLAVDTGKLCTNRLPRILANESSVSLEEMYETEKQLMNSYIDLALGQDSKISIAISGGFDSNLILHFLKERNLSVNAFSIGGKRGLDETIIAENLCKHSGNVFFQKGFVMHVSYESLKSIVEILEGDVYERGVFLQYSLAKLLKEHDVRYVILGEGSDQVFNQNFYEIKTPAYLTNYSDNPYELGSMLVMKKSYMMLSHFGIVGFYPFIHEDMQQLGAQIYIENGISKLKQKEMCYQFFDDFMIELISKNPGSTSLSALFDSKEDEAEFKQYVRDCNEFYSEDFKISYKYGPGESELDYCLCLEYLRAFKELFCE